MSEEQTQQLLYQMQMLEGHFSELSQKEASIVSIIREAASAIHSLKTIDNKADTETLVPLGLGTFVKTKTVPNEKLILNSAINFLELRLKEMQVALQETSNQKQQIAASLEQGKQQMEQLMAASRGKK